MHFRGTTLLRPALAGKALCWRKNQPGALTDATPSRAHCSPVQAPRPCSAPRGLPASIPRAFCQAQTMRTLLFSANAIIMFIIRKKSGFVNKNMKKEPSQSKPDGVASSPIQGSFFAILRTGARTVKRHSFPAKLFSICVQFWNHMESFCTLLPEFPAKCLNKRIFCKFLVYISSCQFSHTLV